MESLESQITSLDQRLNLALVEKLNEEIQNIKVRLQILEKDNTTLINLSNAGYGSYYQTTRNPDRLEPSNFKPTKRPTEIKKKYYW